MAYIRKKNRKCRKFNLLMNLINENETDDFEITMHMYCTLDEKRG
jgi:hypothetical protein